MIPITKNILVIDENGNSLEPTYMKRAKGLVKNGRARWVDDKSICLNTTTCPPQIEEDTVMDSEVFEYIKEQIEFLKQDLTTPIELNMNSEFQPQGAAKITESRQTTKQQIIGLLNRMLDIQNKAGEVNQYQDLLEKLVTDKTAVENAISAISDVDDEVRARAIENIVSTYEETKRYIADQILNK